MMDQYLGVQGHSVPVAAASREGTPVAIYQRTLSGKMTVDAPGGLLFSSGFSFQTPVLPLAKAVEWQRFLRDPRPRLITGLQFDGIVPSYIRSVTLRLDREAPGKAIVAFSVEPIEAMA